MTARFVTSAPSLAALPDMHLPELAMMGRSNVGKSSLLNRLLGSKKLARMSRTPGRTQLLNLFVWQERLALVDMPGYGYAKLSYAKRHQMQGMVHGYVTGRAQLAGVVLLVDARRHDAKDIASDRQMVSWILSHQRPLLVVVTKADLVPKTRRFHHLCRIEAALGVPQGGALMVSSVTAEGHKALRNQLYEMIQP